MLFRDDSIKNDPVKNWHRTDRYFFAAGACHILAHVFLEKYKDKAYQAVLIQPKPGLRGTHVYVVGDIYAFDWHGYSKRKQFESHYFQKMKRLFPGWEASLVPLGSEINLEVFCKSYRHRTPSQFLHDPIERAENYLDQFEEPN